MPDYSKICKSCTIEKAIDVFHSQVYGRREYVWLDVYCKDCRANKNKNNYEVRKTQAMATRSQLIAKRCNKCKLLKTVSNFGVSASSDGFVGNCKDCSNYKLQNREYYLKQKYNISPEQYQQLCEKQNFKCAICERQVKRLAIDHDHETGKIRGLLCIACNSGIGKLGDTIKALEKAIKYLKSQEVTSA